MPDPTVVQPPDLQSAQGVTPPLNVADMVRMMQQLQSAPSPPLFTEPWGQLGAGLAGLGAGFQGQPNPVLQPALQEREQSTARALELARIHLSMQESQRKSRKDRLEALGEMLTHSQQAVREWAAPQFEQSFREHHGVPIPSAVMTQMTQKRLSDKDLDSLYLKLNLGTHTDEVLSQQYGVPLAEMAQHRQAAMNPIILDHLKIKDPVIRAMDQDIKARDAARARHPEVRANSDQEMYAYLIAKQEYGLPLYELTREQVVEIAQRARAMELQDEAEKSAQALERQSAMFLLAEQGRIAAEQRKSLPREAAMGILSAEASARAITQLRELSREPKFRTYLGPVGYAAYITRKTLGFRVPDIMIDAEQALATIRNRLFNLLSGAAVSPDEARRLTEELPSLAVHPDVFLRQLENTEKTILGLEAQTKQLLLPHGPPQAGPRVPSPLAPPRPIPPSVQPPKPQGRAAPRKGWSATPE